MKLLEGMKLYAKKIGVMVGDESVVEGLEKTREKYGVPICPCAFIAEDTRPIILFQKMCPCGEAVSVAEGAIRECTCGLFKEKIDEEGLTETELLSEVIQRKED